MSSIRPRLRHCASTSTSSGELHCWHSRRKSIAENRGGVMTASVNEAIQPVIKSITVNAGPDEAFRVFTEDFDSWWPRSHHIGKSPMKKAIIEGRPRGRCYTQQEDGTDCDWGSILVWDPPKR